MPKKNDIPLKEKFRLWWDFLHGSDKFRQYRDKKIKAQKEWDRKKIYWEIPQKFLSFVFTTKIRGKSISNLYGYFIPIDERPFSKEERQSFLRGFYIWGDIFDRSFEEWWGKYPKNTNVMDYCERIGFDMEFVTELFKQKRKRNPSLNEFKKAFLSFLKKRGESFIVVNPHLNFSFERDGHLIKEIIKKKEKGLKGVF